MEYVTFWMCGLMYICSVCGDVAVIQSDENTCMTIGAIANGIPAVEKTMFSKCGRNVTIIWHYVDTSEIYYIFRTIRILDEQPNVDLIMIFDYSPTILRNPQLLQTTHKQLIKWGHKVQHDELNQIQIGDGHLKAADLCGDEYIPDMGIDFVDCQTDQNVSHSATKINIMHESLTLIAPLAMTSLIKMLSWKRIIILHENATEHEASELIDLLSNNNILFTVFNVDLVKDIQTLLYKLYILAVPTKQQMNVVVLCRFFCARTIFRVANQFDSLKIHRKTLMRTFSRWLVAVYGHNKDVSRALQACADNLDNVVIIAIPEFNGAGTKDFYDILGNIMEQVNFRRLNDSTGNVKGWILNELANKAVLWNPVTRCTGYHIDTLLWTADGRMFSSVGYMNATGYVVIETDMFPNTKYGYNKRHFLMSTVPYQPFMYKRMVNGITVYEGLIIDLLDQLALTLNFTYTMTEPADGMWGSVEKDDPHVEFNGLVGQLQREEVDMVAAPLSVESNRERVMDFTYPLYYDYTAILTKKPDVNATRWHTLLDPFKWQVLLSIGIALPVVTTVVFLLEKYNSFYSIHNHAANRDNIGGLHSLANSFWYIYGALLCQGGVHFPDSTSGRTLISCWWLLCIIVVGTYSGNLIAFLTVTKEKAPFNTIDELVELKDDYKWGTLGGSVWEVVLSRSISGTYKEMAKGLREFNKSDSNIFHKDISFHVNRTREGGYAFIMDKTYMDILVSRYCDLIIMKETFMPLNSAFGFPDKSPHTQIFSKQMMRLHESGLFHVLKRKWWPKTNFCTESTTGAKSISLVDVQSAFYVCLIGIFLGFVVFLVEICWNKSILYRNRPRNTNGESDLSN